MFKTTLIGNLCADPIYREVQLKSGEIVHACNFRVAVNNRLSSNADPVYVQVTTWRGLADACKQYLSKGRKVYVEGQMVAQLGEDKNGKYYANNALNATTVEFLSPRPQQDTGMEPIDDAEEIVEAVEVAPAPAKTIAAPVKRTRRVSKQIEEAEEDIPNLPF